MSITTSSSSIRMTMTSIRIRIPKKTNTSISIRSRITSKQSTPYKYYNNKKLSNRNLESRMGFKTS